MNKKYRNNWLSSLRYGSKDFDLRSLLLKSLAWLKRKPVKILDSDPIFCSQVLSASKVKGIFIESELATPAWHPIYSIESMDGDHYEQLIRDFKILLASLNWREKLGPLTQKHCTQLADVMKLNPNQKLDSPKLTRIVLRILYELIFDQEINADDETLFYESSLEWRKEIAIKGKADSTIKTNFMKRLNDIVSASRFKDGLETYKKDPASYLSVFAQPFLISPQINLSDIFVTVFSKLRTIPNLRESAMISAKEQDRARLGGIILESIRLKHPFPVLERELTASLDYGGQTYAPGTQFFILLDQFKQDQNFDVNRWLDNSNDNPYASIPFAAGPRMCIGKPIAMELMTEMLSNLLLHFNFEQIEPKLNHLYSGRDNDGNESFFEILYQLKTFLKVMISSIKLAKR